MTQLISPDIVVYLCANCLPEGGRLPRQWEQNDRHVVTREVPCSGKMDVQYLMRALEGGEHGLCVVTCPQGECRLSQGNLRAEVRVGMMQRLLSEIGIDPARVELLRCGPETPFEQFESQVREATARISQTPENPLNSKERATTEPA